MPIFQRKTPKPPETAAAKSDQRASLAELSEKLEREQALRQGIEQAYQRLERTLAPALAERADLVMKVDELNDKLKARFDEVAQLSMLLLQFENPSPKSSSQSATHRDAPQEIREIATRREARLVAAEVTIEQLSRRNQALFEELVSVRATCRTLIGDLVTSLRSLPTLDENALAQVVKVALGFDARGYLSKYPDVAAAGVDALSHYLWHGAAEYRSPNDAIDHLISQDSR